MVLSGVATCTSTKVCISACEKQNIWLEMTIKTHCVKNDIQHTDDIKYEWSYELHLFVLRDPFSISQQWSDKLGIA